MYEFHPYYTNDGSVGLYNTEYEDIYHSAKGAVTEAYEKFVEPVDFDNLLAKSEIKVLDICYGIGYNTKSFINFILKNFVLKNKKFFHNKNINIAPIYNDNIYTKYPDNNASIYSNNIFNKISVTAVDNDKILGFLSPFITTCYKKLRNDNLDFNYKNLEKYISNNKNLKFKNSRKNDKLINYLIFNKIIDQYPEIFQDETVKFILNNKEYNKFFEPDIRRIFKNYSAVEGNYIPFLNKLAFLHNIYYNHISNKYKKDLKRYMLSEIDLSFKFDDARNFIKNDSTLYNLIFLDAFTPSKCPCLWSYEFFKQLYNHLEDDGEILTYSTSASVRSAMVEAGFFIGNIFSITENQNIGTIAAKNMSKIKFPLSEFDLGLLKTRAGIFYRDENLTSQNEAIIEARKQELQDSDRISSSKYLKLNKQ